MRSIKTLKLSGTQVYGSNTIGEIIEILPEVFNKFDIECSCDYSGITFSFDLYTSDIVDTISPDAVIYVLERIREFVSFDTLQVGFTYTDFGNGTTDSGILTFEMSYNTSNIDKIVYSVVDD